MVFSLLWPTQIERVCIRFHFLTAPTRRRRAFIMHSWDPERQAALLYALGLVPTEGGGEELSVICEGLRKMISRGKLMLFC